MAKIENAAPAWIQAMAVVIGLMVAVWQLSHARKALESSASSNALTAEALRVQRAIETSDLLRTVHLMSLDLADMPPERLDDRSTGYSPRERLHLLRVLYLERTFLLHQEKLISSSRWEAECNYRTWVVARPGFREMWTRGSDAPGGALYGQYEADFARWINEGLESLR